MHVDRCECVSNLYVSNFNGEVWHLPLSIDFKLRILWAFAAHGIGWQSAMGHHPIGHYGHWSSCVHD